MEESKSTMLEQNKQEKPMSVLSKSLITGFVGGVLWSFLGAIAYYFNFTTISSGSFVLRSFFQTEWTGTWLGELISILVIGLLSLATALIYFSVLKKTKGLWPSILFGVALWLITFFVFQPVFQAVPKVGELDGNTIVTTLCLFILYSVFIGYSISYDYQVESESQSQSQNTEGH
ncbi:hypothetical protein N781_05875 [Pontibacillus halophilus JSM 076056 = DSM 19796]|uniref:Uncharacterized protein n=1 Tax=Pontibacillus halophilus JSM 076056 = DSM 19796 TaxID=1385510 RepID=A0A0A5GID5_9BACI|nr:YqhR family membrane protein [Pontibacillus halophilus]KGX90895.1 hypothetical protein N781_05875 [Pontibacillus halophilus JSM 076056 = DSM 19796]